MNHPRGAPRRFAAALQCLRVPAMTMGNAKKSSALPHSTTRGTCAFSIRDRDHKFGGQFAAVTAGANIEVSTMPPRSPKLNAIRGGSSSASASGDSIAFVILGEHQPSRCWTSGWSTSTESHRTKALASGSLIRRQAAMAIRTGASWPSRYWAAPPRLSKSGVAVPNLSKERGRTR